MKKIYAFLATAIIVLSILSIEKANAFLTLEALNIPEKAVIQLNIPDNHSASITISDETGTTLHSEMISAGTETTRIYDFTKLNDGIYTIYSSIEHSMTTKKIRVKGPEVEIVSKLTEYSPVFQFEDDLLMVNYFNKDQEDTDFVIQSSDYDFVSEELGNSVTIGKIFDLSSLVRGDYYAVMTVGDRKYHHQFRID